MQIIKRTQVSLYLQNTYEKLYWGYIMAIIIRTVDPELLLSTVRDSIVRTDIKGWLKHEKRDLFTYALEPYARKAWFHSRILPGELRFDIIFPTRCIRRKEYYAICHGKMLGMLLGHFLEEITHIEVTVENVEHDAGGKIDGSRP